MAIVLVVIKNVKLDNTTKHATNWSLFPGVLDNMVKRANAAIMLKKKYIKANHRLGIMFRMPNNGNPKVIVRSSMVHVIIGKVNALLYFFDNQNKQPITERSINSVRPVVSAIRSISGGSIVAYPETASGRFRKSAYSVIYVMRVDVITSKKVSSFIWLYSATNQCCNKAMP